MSTKMVVSHRETSISSNIRAIIEQLNFNPVERRRLIDRTRDNGRIRPVSSPAKITIGVYGCRERDGDVKKKIDIYKECGNERNIELFRDETGEISRSKIPGDETDKTKSEVFNDDGDDDKLRIEIFKNRRLGGGDDGDAGAAEMIKSPSGKVTIGIWGQGKSQLKIERAGSFARVIRNQGTDDNKSVVVSRSRKPETRQRMPTVENNIAEVTRTQQQDVVERITPALKEDLPEFESASLNHGAAHHRISVRPKNRRPPRRTVPTTTMSHSTIRTISESSDAPDSLEPITISPDGSPIDSKASSILRKSSSRLSRNSEIFDELESKLPGKQSTSVSSLSPDSLDSATLRTIIDNQDADEREIKSVSRRHSNRNASKSNEIFGELESRLPKRTSSNRNSKSPENLDNLYSKSSDVFDKFIGNDDIKVSIRRNNNLISKSIEGFDKISESIEVKPMPRRLTNAISKSTDGFDKFIEHDEPRPVARRFLQPISKSSDIPPKSSKSLEILESLTGDDTIERRRSSFEIRPRRGIKVMSMSSENVELLDQVEELQKRNSASDVNLSRGKIQCKIISKSSESFEPMETSYMQEESNVSSMDVGKANWRSSKRVSSESSDNLDDDKNERKIRRPPKRVPSSSITDIFQKDNGGEEEKRPVPMRKPLRLQKSSESSELGSTDTLDSERRNKSSESTETLDSLEKDGDHDVKDEEMADAVVEKRNKHDLWIKGECESTKADNQDEPKSPDKNYWRQTSESKENIDIHQLLAITIVSRMSENGNNQRNSTVQFQKKKLTSPPTSPTVKQEDNKLLFNNLLANKNDEDLQNMLNGNISEVSTTDTKSFREKLIMFEKLGK